MQTELLDNPTRCAIAKPLQGQVLVVDDEEPNRTLLRDSLEPHGYEIEEAADGEEALRKVAAWPPEVVLLDVMMPGMDGFEVCERLKKEPVTASIPVLMVTALSSRQERLMGIAVGANDFLNKPVDLQDLSLRVRNAVYTKRLYDQLRAEQQKSERLLLNVLPQRIAERMKQGELNIADAHDEVSVLVADLAGFTRLSAHVGPEQILALLNEIFSAFDVLVEKRGLEKIKTIGDAYMVAGGLSGQDPGHVESQVRLALEMRDEVERFNAGYNTSLRLRIGLSIGPVVAGVIGCHKFAYDLWGDTVNLACQLEASAEPGVVCVSAGVFERLAGGHPFEKRLLRGIKGREDTVCYVLTR
jgi:class 3 adenylate cyclase